MCAECRLLSLLTQGMSVVKDRPYAGQFAPKTEICRLRSESMGVELRLFVVILSIGICIF